MFQSFAPGDSWPQETIDRVAATHEVVKAALKDMGYEVEDTGNVNRTMEDMVKAGRELRYRSVRLWSYMWGPGLTPTAL